MKEFMMRLVGLAIALVPVLVSTAAYSRDVKVGNSMISVSPPQGFCEVDRKNKDDKSWEASVINLLNAANLTVISAYPDCREQKKMRASDEFIMTKFYFTAPNSMIGKATTENLDQTCDELRSRQYSDSQKAELAETAKEYANGNTQMDAKALGVLEATKGDVCYVATLQKVKTRQGGVATMLALFAVTIAHDDMLFLYQYTPYVDASSMPTALSTLKIAYSDFAAANKK